MKILSWNINGIRASKRDLKELFDSLQSDVICLQETKVTRDMLDEATAIVDGYNSFYSYSRKRSGYSGVATYCKDHVTPEKAEEGLSGILSAENDGKIGCYGNHSSFTDDEIVSLDAEGRAVITQHRIEIDGCEKDLCIINVYCPRFDPDREDRHLYKLRFYALLQTRAEALIENGSHVIILGDINTTHKPQDRSDNEEESAGRTPSRLWLNQMVWEKDKEETLAGEINQDEFSAVTPHTKGGMFVDTYRYFYPDKEGAFSNWCTLTNARATNYGRRLDYIFADVKLAESCLVSASIMQDVQGSDHCPVTVELSCKCTPAKICPPLCTKFMPEFSGKQQKLSSFFTKVDKSEIISCQEEKTNGYSSQTLTNSQQDKGGKRLLEKSDSISQSQKRQKTNGKMNMGKSGQATLKNFFVKPNIKSDKSTVNTHTKDIKIIPDINVNNKSDKEKDTGSFCKYFNKTEHDKEMQQKQENDIKLSKEKSKETAKAWKNLLGGLGPAPLCKGHNEPCVLRMVKKEGPNKGKQFYVCNRGEGLKNNPEARCDFFKWVEKKKT